VNDSSQPPGRPAKAARFAFTEMVRGMRWVWALGGLTPAQLARRVWRGLVHEDALGRAAELSYYFLLALFPFLICVSSIAGMFFSSEAGLYERVLAYLRGVMPATAFAIVETTMRDVTAGAGGTRVSLALAAALWTASLGMDALINGLNDAYDIKEFRPWWKRRLVALALTTVLLTLLLLALILLLGAEYFGRMLEYRLPGEWLALILVIAGWTVVVFAALLGLSVIYLFAPNLTEQRWHAVMPGASVAFTCWVLASLGLRLYLSWFDSYSKTYGSLGAVIVLLLWLYLSAAAILVGGEVNAQIRSAAAEAGAAEAQRIREASP
jgi:membrane protein